MKLPNVCKFGTITVTESTVRIDDFTLDFNPLSSTTLTTDTAHVLASIASINWAIQLLEE